MTRRAPSMALRIGAALLAGSAGLPLPNVLAFADDKPQLPPLGVVRGGNGQPDMILDLKTDKNASAADGQSGLPLVRKEPMVPFVGFSLTRPIGGKN